jgi:hypothetical protein
VHRALSRHYKPNNLIKIEEDRYILLANHINYTCSRVSLRYIQDSKKTINHGMQRMDDSYFYFFLPIVSQNIGLQVVSC